MINLKTSLAEIRFVWAAMAAMLLILFLTITLIQGRFDGLDLLICLIIIGFCLAGAQLMLRSEKRFAASHEELYTTDDEREESL